MNTDCPASTSQVVFLFPGQGSQQVDMARPLYDTEPVFRSAVDACAHFLRPLLKHDLRSTLFPSEDERDHAERDIHRPLFTQPCVFTISYAFACLWMSRGIQPALLIGHGFGEYAAAVIARSFTLENALTLLASRARRIHELPAGGMLALHRSADRLVLPDGIDLASIDGPDRCTVSGSREAIHAYLKSPGLRDTVSHMIPSSHAFHSAAMDPILRSFTGDAAMIPCAAPAIPWISTVTGRHLDDATLADPAYWAQQMRHPVDIHGALTTAFAEPNRVMLEVGPSRGIASLAKRHPDRGTTPVISSQAEGSSCLAGVRHALDELLAAGSGETPPQQRTSPAELRASRADFAERECSLAGMA